MKDKKKNLTKDRTYANDTSKEGHIGPNGPVFYEPAYILSNNARGACHLHPEPLEFRTFTDLQKHMTKTHDYRKGQTG